MTSQHQEQFHKPPAPLQLCTPLSRTFLHRQLHRTPSQTATLPGAKGRQEVSLMSSTTCRAARMRTSRSSSLAPSRSVLAVLPSLVTHLLLFHHRANGQRFRSSNPRPHHFRHHSKYSFPQQSLRTSRTAASVYRARLLPLLWMVA